jgi:hypothetical protein
MAKTTTPVDTSEEIPSASAQGAEPVDYDRMGDAIGNAVAKGIAANTRRKITFGEYQARGGISQYHPDPSKKVKMNRDYFNNGRLIEYATAYDREIELLNQITHSGRYIDRLVEVVVTQNGSEEVVDIRFSNKTQFAFELKGKARDFTDMLEQIVAAQKIEREEREEFENNRSNRRHFGAGKASTEARAKA